MLCPRNKKKVLFKIKVLRYLLKIISNACILRTQSHGAIVLKKIKMNKVVYMFYQIRERV